MPIIHLEGFDGGDYSNRYYITQSGNSLQSGRTGTNGLAICGVGLQFYRFSIPAALESDTICAGFAIRHTSLNPNEWLSFKSDIGATSHITLTVLADGRLGIHRGTTTMFLSDPGVSAPDNATWTHVEMEVKLSDTVGTIRLWANGRLICDLSNQDTKNGGTKTTFDAVWFSGDGGGMDVVIDDLVIANEAGPYGDIAVYTLLPNGNGNSSDLVGSDADSIDNYLLVDEATPSSADYVGSDTGDEHDGYTFADLPVSVGTIKAVEARAYAWKTDSGTKGVRLHHRENSVDSYGDDWTLSTSPQTYPEIWEQNPARSADWTITQVNQSEFGAAVRAGS